MEMNTVKLRLDGLTARAPGLRSSKLEDIQCCHIRCSVDGMCMVRRRC